MLRATILFLLALASQATEDCVELTSTMERRYEFVVFDHPALRSSGITSLKKLCAPRGSCFHLNVDGPSTVTVGPRSLACDRDCAFAGCVDDNGIANLRLHEATDKARMPRMFDQVRRLSAFSYDFDCTSSLNECIDDSQCESDEACEFARRNRLRRSLLFGTNTVGQCVCL